MFNFNIDPELLKIGFLHIRYYGLIYALGFIITYFYLENLRKKEKLELNKDQIYDLIFYLVIGVVVGARVFEILFWNPSYYFSNLKAIFLIWNGGMSFHGGLVGAFIAVYLFSKKNKINFLKLSDIIVIPATLALALGRIGNFLNMELYGTVTNVPWCVNFADIIGCRHPYQIYSFLGHLISFFILFRLNKEDYKEGKIFLIGILSFGIVRFILDFYREDLRYFGLSLGQYFSIPLILISLYFLIKKYRTIP